MGTVKRRVVIVSHADADGHLIAEQTRRNLELIPSFNVSTVVDPIRTKDHRIWTELEGIKEIDDADFVFFVDLMFAPASFAAEAQGLVDYVEARREKRFFLLDHHPLPLRRLDLAKNLRVMYRPEVFECAIGPRSGMMVVAALCEKQHASVADIKQPVHELLAVGMRRAAAPGGPLPGKKLLALLRSDRWNELAELARDDLAFHWLPRGRRPANVPVSKTLMKLSENAEQLLERKSTRVSVQSKRGVKAMAYDLDEADSVNVSRQRFEPSNDHRSRTNAPIQSKDLEAIVTLLEVAALSLTPDSDATFTYEELLKEAQELGGDDLTIEEADVKIVLEKASFLKKLPGKRLRLK